MINNFRDHSANERTYLAWIRTSIAIMAFGFLIEKFDLFISYLGLTFKENENFKASFSAEFVGLALFIIGVIIIFMASIRYFSYEMDIDKKKVIKYRAKKTNVIFSLLILFLSLFIFFYLFHRVIG